MYSSEHSAPVGPGTGATFDLDAYCARIKYTGSLEPSITTLKGLHSAHVHSVPFENFDILLGKPLSLAPAYHRRSHRGG
ncbi:MAG: arylamine N-acetyltransferase [Candidatus Binatia bacterium]|nr:arylamine N-acetyltransferase [Candidatus Binatia bacterium]